jgi:oxygen-independent coproporphyrinogen-3 oxidase
VPWIKPGQRGYEDADLPSDAAKRSLYDTGRELLLQAGYHDIGMDHFAKVTDPLYVAAQNKTLHRNFMGYTTSQTDLLIGLGASAISDAKYAYAQNAKKVEDYSFHIEQQRLAVVKGHIHTRQDRLVRQAILSIACNGLLKSSLYVQVVDAEAEKQFQQMQEEGILVLANSNLTVTEAGRAFIRNICQVLDKRMHEQKHAVQFSKAI